MGRSSGRGSTGAGAVAWLVAVITTLSCAAPTTAPDEPSDPTPGGAVTTRADGTMTVEEFEDDIRGAVEVAERYWEERFTASGQAFQPIRRVIAYERDGEVACGGKPLTRNNAAYCSAGDFIAYDVNWAVAAFRQVGDAFVFYLLGHEYAHGVQVRLGVSYDFTIQQELQADCLAGAYLGDSVKTQALRLDDGDLDELREGLLAVGDDPGQPWFSEGAHGTPRQRTDAFFAGYERSLSACGIG